MKNIYKASFAALAITPLIGLFGQNTYAAMPNTFKDENFYNCVVENFILDYPDEAIAETGLTNEQLGKMEWLECGNNEIADTTGLELMTSLKDLFVRSDNLTSIDLSKNTNLIAVNLWSDGGKLSLVDISNNPNIALLELDSNTLLETGIIPEKDGNRLKYDFSKLKFLDLEAIATAVAEFGYPINTDAPDIDIFSSCQTVEYNDIDLNDCKREHIEYDKENRALYVADLSAINNEVQIVAVRSTNDAPSEAYAYAKLKLAEPRSDIVDDDPSISSPDTGYFTGSFDASGVTLSTVGVLFGALIVGLLPKLSHRKIGFKE